MDQRFANVRPEGFASGRSGGALARHIGAAIFTLHCSVKGLMNST
jgi:hypothetical protein